MANLSKKIVNYSDREPLELVEETKPGFRDNVLSFLSFVVFSDIFILKPKTLIYLK